MSEKVIGEIKPSDASGGTRASTERPGELEVGMQTIPLEAWRRLRQMYDVETARGWLKSISEDYKSVVVSEGLRWCDECDLSVDSYVDKCRRCGRPAKLETMEHYLNGYISHLWETDGPITESLDEMFDEDDPIRLELLSLDKAEARELIIEMAREWAREEGRLREEEEHLCDDE